MKVDDCRALPVLQPPITRDLSIVVVRMSVSPFPLVELVGGQTDPDEQLADRQSSAVFPVVDVIDDLVSRIVRNPATGQSSPFSFFERMFSSISSEITSFLAPSFCRSACS